MAIFDESVLFEKWTGLVELTRRYSAESVIYHCMDRLPRSDKLDYNYVSSYQPWHLLLLLKWTYEEGDFKNKRGITNISEFNQIYGALQNLEGIGRLPSQYENHFLYFRTLAFQQFWFQKDINTAAFFRQLYIFDRLDSSSQIREQLQKLVGMTIKDFHLISLGILAGLKTGRDSCSVCWSVFGRLRH